MYYIYYTYNIIYITIICDLDPGHVGQGFFKNHLAATDARMVQSMWQDSPETIEESFFCTFFWHF